MIRLSPRKTVLALLVVGALGGAYALAGGQPPAVGTPPALPAVTAAPATASAFPDLAAIVARHGAAVVNLMVSGHATRPALAADDPLSEFFRRFGAVPEGGAPVHGQGSGFIVSADGTILTNAHVVEGADEVMVKLTDRREFKARVIGADAISDVAVLKIEAQGLPYVQLGNSAATRVGDWVLAIGSPFGFENSASAGIVSAKSRALPDGNYVPFLQTDVAVNPGNSGGPLFNVRGEVIGINSQIYSRSGGYQGLSFAIPIEVALNVEQQLLQHGKVERGRLGVAIQEVNQALADAFGLERPRGALVSAVEPGGPAAHAGVESGDVILTVNGREVAVSSELPAQIASLRAGDSVRLGVWRRGQLQSINVQLGRAPVAGDAPPQAQAAAIPGRLGVAARTLNASEARQLGIKAGVGVEAVTGPAARAGLLPGDVILALNGDAVSSVEQLQARVAQAGRRLAVLVLRQGSRIFVPVELG